MPQLFTNNARALLASGITDTATSLTVEAAKADLFPTANTNTASVPASATNWFKLTLQDAVGNVEIIYVRTRAAGSAVMSNIIRGQEGTTARAFSAGTVVGLRITAADVEGSIAAGLNSVQLTGAQSINGAKTFTSQITASGGVAGNVDGSTGKFSGSVVAGGTGAAAATLDVQTTGANAVTSLYTTGLSDLNFRIGSMNGVAGSAGTSQGKLGLFYLGVGETATIDFRRGATTTDGSFAFRTSGTDRATLDNSGNFTATGDVTAYSDIRLKTDLTKIAGALAKVNQLNGYTYTRIDTGERHAGVVAQEVREVLPEVVHEHDDGTLSVAYGNMIGLLIEAIKEQSRVIDALTARVEKLEGR